jgi:hypothetical protein
MITDFKKYLQLCYYLSMLKKALLLTLLAFAFFVSPSFSQGKPFAITVSPYIVNIDLAQDPPEETLYYTNNSSVPATLSLSAQDFTLLEDSYKLKFLDPKESQNYQYSLSSWISFENRLVQLNPGEKKGIKIFIDKDRIPKGSHYATIQAEVIQQNSGKDIPVKAVLSSLLFVRAATGKEYETGSILDFRPLQDTIEFPNQIRVRFEDSGNVDVIPYGLIQIYDPLGNLIGKGILNQDSNIVLPESIRNFDTNVILYQRVLLPGFYTASVSIHYGKTNQKLNASVRFFSQGMFDFVKIGLGLILLVAIILYLRKRKSPK